MTPPVTVGDVLESTRSQRYSYVAVVLGVAPDGRVDIVMYYDDGFRTRSYLPPGDLEESLAWDYVRFQDSL